MTSAKITLCCVATERHAAAADALRRCAAAMPFAKTVFITNRAEHVDHGWEWHRIHAFDNGAEFARFMLKHLFAHIETEHALIISAGSGIRNPQAWSDDVLAHDYVGAPWQGERYPVGSGGFSLRSRKLLQALQDSYILLPPRGSVTEDRWIGQVYRSYLETCHGISFAPADLAGRFSHASGDAFGTEAWPEAEVAAAA